jgi:hypothetical protein
MEATATGGKIRTIRGQQVHTATVVNDAILTAVVTDMDLADARLALVRMGHTNPALSIIERYATERAILAQLERLTGANALSQLGRWNMNSAQTILAAFDSYLDRRILGMKANFTTRR